MKRKLADWARVKVSTAILNTAEVLPRFRGGLIAMLQSRREHQREAATRAYDSSRPPGETRVEYIGFRMFELYQIEDVEKLLTGLRRMFPQLSDDFRSYDFGAEFQRHAWRISGGGWWNVGHLISQENRFFGDVTRRLVDLPLEVDWIDVSVYKTLPSLFIVSFDVHLTEEATRKLTVSHAKHYLPTIRFRRIIPSGRLGGGYSTEHAESVRREAVSKWLAALQGKVEACISPYISGYFLRHVTGHVSKLPSIQVYVLRGLPESVEAISTWRAEARSWSESMGFELLDINLYTDGKLMFVPRYGRMRADKAPHQLFVLWESFRSTMQLDGYGSEEAATWEHAKDMLTSMTPTLAIIELLDIEESRIALLRRAVYHSMRRTWLAGLFLGPYIQLNDALLGVSMILDRTASEMDLEVRWLRHDLNDLSDLLVVEPLGDGKTTALPDALFDIIQYRLRLLKGHTAFVRDWYAQYLNLRNITVTYWLAVIVGVATIIGLIGIDNLKLVFKGLLTKLVP